MGTGLELEGRRKDGTTFPVEIGLSVIATSTGKLGVAFVSDITQRKQMEQAARAHTEQVQALAASLLTAQEEERRRVSRELHDQICQQLASMALDIERLAADFPPLAGAQSRVADLRARIIKASEQTRHIAYELHPSVLDDLGVVASLQSLCKEFSERTKIPVEFTSVAMPPKVPREIASCLYRVSQESLENIAKHSGAKRVSVALAVHKGTGVLTITDDGAGFDLEAVKGRGGLGFIGMEERARLINGKLSIAAKPGHGTRIALRSSFDCRQRMKRARIILADDHTLTLEGIRAVIEPHHEIVGMVPDGRALVDAALRLNPDLILLDITMPLLNGIDAAVQIKKSLPGVKLLFVTMHINPAYLEAALNAGGNGYVLKSASREEFLEAIKSVIDGRIYVSPTLSSEHLERFKDPARAAATLRLTVREREILQLIAEGRAAKEIAHLLSISINTVAFHRENIKRKLGLRTTAELTKHAIEQGLV